jgi:granule-bound starch synthase
LQVWGKTGSKLYGAKSGADYVDNPKRFRVFSEACIEAVRALPFGPGEDCVFVANDWHSAMLPVLLKVLSSPLSLHGNVLLVSLSKLTAVIQSNVVNVDL